MKLKRNWLENGMSSREAGGIGRCTRFGQRRWLMPAVAVGMGVLGIAPCGCKPGAPPAPTAVEGTTPAALSVTETPSEATAGTQRVLPRLLDLGAHACIPCKKMAPILEELKKEYAAVFETEFIDVWQNPDAGKQHGIDSIPTQIFFDANGKEVFRHVGFISKEDILAKWKEFGISRSSAE